MNQIIINKYTDEVLYNTLVKLKIDEKYVKEITENIKEQIYAVIYHWNDIYFRNGLLVIGLEEGLFYEPEADINIKSLIVVAVRNSLLELLFSVESYKVGLSKPLPEPNVKLITSEAINYFKDINFNELCEDVRKENINDKYQEIVSKYPMAWKAICELGNCIGKKKVYQNLEVKDKMKLSDLEIDNENKNKYNKNFIEDTQSGISEKFGKGLIEQLKNVIDSEECPVFYVDCFKMISRNFEKILKTIEIILENNKTVLTSNYFISNSYLGKRDNIYRAAHGDDVYEKIKEPDFLLGVSKTHREKLLEFLNEMGIE